MTLAPINNPAWWAAAEEIGWYVGSISVFHDQVVVSARRDPVMTGAYPPALPHTTIGIARTDDEAVMIRAMQTLLRLEGGPQ